jgi:hypothetical protein
MVGMGGAFRLPGLQKYLQEKLQLDVRKLTKFARLQGDSVITAPVFNDNVMSMGVVYGLALQGLKGARIHTNLLPQEIRLDRLVRSKKPWAVAAAACLLLGVGGLAFGTRMEHDAVASPDIQAVIEGQGDPALKKAQDSNQQFAAQQREVEKLKAAVRTIVAGQEERLNWIKLNKFINDCLPRPDGQGLTDKQKELFGDKGKVAWNQFVARQMADKNQAAAASEEGLEDLMQINLEAVNALYCDDLGAYFKRLEADKRLNGMPQEDKDKPPTGAGWVVELRGYTFHQAQRDFVVETLLANIISKSKKPTTPAKPGELDPITAKVSHPVLYAHKPMENTIPGKFELIESSDLYVLVHGAPLGKGERLAPTGSGAAATPRSQRDGWRPLGLALASYAPRDGDKGLLQGASGGPAKPTQRGQYMRTEFIILFIWREPTFDVAPPSTPAPGKAPPGKAPPGK